MIILIGGASHTGKTLLGDLEVDSLFADDYDAAARLFCDTVHAVNARDYAADQLDAWAPCDDQHRAQIVKKLAGQKTASVKERGIIVGFGSLDDKGDVDMLFVHKDRQGQGIGSTILEELEHMAVERGKEHVSLFSSITAKPFLEHVGYAAERENSAVRNGVPLANYLMSKRLQEGKTPRDVDAGWA